jgi:hypothetical protein
LESADEAEREPDLLLRRILLRECSRKFFQVESLALLRIRRRV